MLQNSKGNRKGRRWSKRVLARYFLLQLPELALLILIMTLLQRWKGIPNWIVWGIVALWVAKDVLLFPFTWRAYDAGGTGDGSGMVGERGIAKDRLVPSGYVRVRGELWRAEVMGGGPPIERGERIKVSGVQGLTLLVTVNGEETE